MPNFPIRWRCRVSEKPATDSSPAATAAWGTAPSAVPASSGQAATHPLPAPPAILYQNNAMKTFIRASFTAVCLLAFHAPASARDHRDDGDRGYGGNRLEDLVRDVDAFYDHVSSERRDFGSTRHIDDEIATAHDDLSHVHSEVRNHRDPDRIRDELHGIKIELYRIDQEIRVLAERDREPRRRGFTLRFGN